MTKRRFNPELPISELHDLRAVLRKALIRLDRYLADQSDAPRDHVNMNKSRYSSRGPGYQIAKRADLILSKKPTNDPEFMLTTLQVAAWLGVSTQFLSIGRVNGYEYGPKYIKISERILRYRQQDVIDYVKGLKSKLEQGE